MALWTPYGVSTQYWFDASDESFVDVSGGQVSAWYNNSGAYLYISPVSTTPNYVTGAINSLNAIEFSESSDAFVFPNKGIFNYKTSATIFAVGIGVATSAGSRDFVVEKYPVGYDPAFIALRSIYSGTQTCTEAGYTRTPNDTEQSLSVAHSTSGATVMMSEVDWQHASLRVGVNGTVTTLGVDFQEAGTSYSPDGADYPYIGLSVGAVAAPVTIGEVIIITGRVLSDRERQCFEGYLAWKWGIPLPSGHLFELAPPEEGDEEEPIVEDWVIGDTRFGGVSVTGSSISIGIATGSLSISPFGVYGESNYEIGRAAFQGISVSGSSINIPLVASGIIAFSGVTVSGNSRPKYESYGSVCFAPILIRAEAYTDYSALDEILHFERDSPPSGELLDAGVISPIYFRRSVSS